MADRARWYRGCLIRPGHQVKNNLLGHPWVAHRPKTGDHANEPMAYCGTFQSAKNAIDEHVQYLDLKKEAEELLTAGYDWKIYPGKTFKDKVIAARNQWSARVSGVNIGLEHVNTIGESQ